MDLPETLDASSPDAQYLNYLHELDKQLRGPYLVQAIWIEELIDDIISQHFCPEDQGRRSLLIGLILNHRDMTFSGKIDILEKIVKRSYPGLLKDHPGLVDRLTKVRRFR